MKGGVLSEEDQTVVKYFVVLAPYYFSGNDYSCVIFQHVSPAVYLMFFDSDPPILPTLSLFCT